MKRINGMVSNDAKEVLVDWKKKRGFTTLDESLQDLLLEFRERMRQEEQDYKQEVCAQIEHENRDTKED